MGAYFEWLPLFAQEQPEFLIEHRDSKNTISDHLCCEDNYLAVDHSLDSTPLGDRYLRVVVLEDKITIHNAFLDRRFRL